MTRSVNRMKTLFSVTRLSVTGEDRDDKECQNRSSSRYADPLLLASVVKLYKRCRGVSLMMEARCPANLYRLVAAKSQQQISEESRVGAFAARARPTATAGQ